MNEAELEKTYLDVEKACSEWDSPECQAAIKKMNDADEQVASSKEIAKEYTEAEKQAARDEKQAGTDEAQKKKDEACKKPESVECSEAKAEL